MGVNSELEFRRKSRFRPRPRVSGRRFCRRVRGVRLQPGRQLRYLEQLIVGSERTFVKADYCKSKVTIQLTYVRPAALLQHWTGGARITLITS